MSYTPKAATRRPRPRRAVRHNPWLLVRDITVLVAVAIGGAALTGWFVQGIMLTLTGGWVR